MLADPTRVRLLHTVSTSSTGAMRVGDLATALGISQSTCSHHVRKLADVGFVTVDKVGTASIVSVNPACCTGLPHAADVVMGTLSERPCCPEDLPADVTTRAMTDADLAVVRDIYAEGSPPATPPSRPRYRRPRRSRRSGWPTTAGSPSSTARSSAGPRSRRSPADRATPASARPACTSPRRPAAAASARRCSGRQVNEADEGGLWTLQTAIFPENRASIALHHSAGYETLAVRSRIARLDGVWRDTVLLERRRAG